MAQRPIIQAFFDEPTNTIGHLVADPAAKKGRLSIRCSTMITMMARSIRARPRSLLQAANDAGYSTEWVLETHAHAYHLCGAPYIKAKTGAKIGIGEHIKDVQRIFRPAFNAADLNVDGPFR